MSVSVGAIVGIAIGSIVAGAALGVLVRPVYRDIRKCLCPPEWQHPDWPDIGQWTEFITTLTMYHRHPAGGSDPAGRDDILLAQNHCAYISNCWSGGFVGSYHPRSKAYKAAGPEVYEAMQQLTGTDCDDWAAVIPTNISHDALAAYVARVLTPLTLPTCGLETTLLPPPLVRMWQMISKVPEDGSHPAFKNDDKMDCRKHSEPESANIMLLNKEIGHDWMPRAMYNIWRPWTVRWIAHEFPLEAKGTPNPEPMSHIVTRHPLPETDERNANIIKAEEALIRTLKPFGPGILGPIDGPESRKVLRHMVEEYAFLALLYFGQSEETKLVWPEDALEFGEDRQICMFPAVEQRRRTIDDMTMLTSSTFVRTLPAIRGEWSIHEWKTMGDIFEMERIRNARRGAQARIREAREKEEDKKWHVLGCERKAKGLQRFCDCDNNYPNREIPRCQPQKMAVV